MSDEQKTVASREIIQFVSRFTDLLEKQLLSIRETMTETVDQVMNGVANLSEATEDKKKAAEKALESTYLNPDEETESLVEDLQKSVDALFEKATVSLSDGGEANSTSEGHEELLKGRLQRFNGKFLGHVGHLDQLDQEMKDLLIGMMGALSADDVIAQRMDHVVSALHGLTVSLSYVLLDFEQRSSETEIALWKENLKRYTYKQYTMEEEKNLFAKTFPNEAKKAS